MVNYVIKQFNNSHSAYNGQFYAKAVMVGEDNLQTISEKIQRMCTVTVHDIKAVLSALVEVMSDSLRESRAVRLDGFGTFKIALKTSLAPTVDKFSVNHNIYGMRVNFLPEYSIDKDGNHISKLTSGVKVKEYVNYNDNASL